MEQKHKGREDQPAAVGKRPVEGLLRFGSDLTASDLASILALLEIGKLPSQPANLGKRLER